MHARRYWMVSIVAASGFAPLACSSLLGDFSTGNGATGGPEGGGGGPETSGPVIDGAVGPDAPGSDGNPVAQDGQTSGDAPNAPDAPDAAPTLLTCAEKGGAVRTKLGSIATNTNNGNQGGVRIFNTSIGNQTQYRAVVLEQPTNTYHVYSFGNGGGGSNVQDIAIEPGNGLDVERYPGGIAILADTDQALAVFQLADTATNWAMPQTVGSLPSCVNSLQGGLFVASGGTSEYYAQATYETCFGSDFGNTVAYYAPGQLVQQSWPFPPQDDAGPDAAPPLLGVAGITVSGSNIYALTSSENGPPTAGVSAATYSDSLALTNPVVHNVPFVNPADIMVGLSMHALASSVGVAVLEANLYSPPPLIPVIYVGNVPAANVASLALTDLRPTTFNGLDDLVINGSYHWESFTSPNPVSDNLLAVSPIPNSMNGLNFVWWNASGGVLAKQTSTNALFYLSPDAGGPAIYGGDVTFQSSPFPSLADFEVVFVQQVIPSDVDGAATSADVWATQVVCTAN